MLPEYGHWAGAINSIALGDDTLSAAAPINYRVPTNSTNPADDDYLTTRDLRVCSFGSNHPGGATFAFIDGAVRFLNQDLPLETLHALSTHNGGELVAVP